MLRSLLLALLLIGFSGAWAVDSQPSAEQADIRDIRGPLKSPALPPFALSGILLLGGACFYLAAKARGRRPVPAAASACHPPLDLHSQLERLVAAYRNGTCSPAGLATALDSLLRQLFVLHCETSAINFTSQELLSCAASVSIFDNNALAALERALLLCENVKFSGGEPSAVAMEQALTDAALLVTVLAGDAGP